MLTATTPAGAGSQYGLGWRLGVGGRGCSARTFGHSGATGITAWLDPDRGLGCVLLTSLPSARSERSLLTPVSDIVAAAF